MSSVSDFDKVKAILLEVHQAFGGREYSDKQIEIVLAHAKLYGMPNLRRVASRLMENGTRKPFPIDFKNALQNLSAELKPQQSEKEYEVQCKHCFDTGYVFLKKEYVEYLGKPLIALCKCSIAWQMNEYDEKLPRIGLEAWGFVDVFPVHGFVPARRSEALKSKSGLDRELNFGNVLQKWKMLKNNAREYWSKQNEKKQNN